MTPDEIVANRAKEILTLIEGGHIFGIAVNTRNIDHLIVAAYFCGQMYQLQYTHIPITTNNEPIKSFQS